MKQAISFYIVFSSCMMLTPQGPVDFLAAKMTNDSKIRLDFSSDRELKVASGQSSGGSTQGGQAAPPSGGGG